MLVGVGLGDISVSPGIVYKSSSDLNVSLTKKAIKYLDIFRVFRQPDKNVGFGFLEMKLKR